MVLLRRGRLTPRPRLTPEAPPERCGELLGTALGAAVTALLGTLVGGAARHGAARRVVAVAALGVVLTLWAAGMPAPRRRSAGRSGSFASSLRRANVVSGVWLIAPPSLPCGCLTVLGPLILDAVLLADSPLRPLGCIFRGP